MANVNGHVEKSDWSKMVPKVKKISLREKVPEQYQHNFDKKNEQDGVQITEFKHLDPKNIQVAPEKHQSRVETYNEKHLKRFESMFEENKGWVYGMDPICLKFDGIHGHYVLISGHHRHEAARRAELDKIPCFIVDFPSRADGKDSELEFKQKENAHHITLPHSDDDAVKYLLECKEKGYFDDNEFEHGTQKHVDAIRDTANELLKQNYSHYSHQKRRGIVTRFINAQGPALIKRWKNGQVKEFFVANNHLDSIDVYNVGENRFDIVTQSHTLATQAPGIAQAKLRITFNKMMELGATEDKIKELISNMKIRVGVYVEKASSFKELKQKREAALKAANEMNRDDLLSPLVFNEVYFAYQSRQQPKEAAKPIMWVWDKNDEKKPWKKKKKSDEDEF